MKTAAAAIDLGGSHVACAIVDEEKVLATESFDVEPNPLLAPLLPRFGEIFGRLAREAGIPLRECLGCAMGLPLAVDAPRLRIPGVFGKYDDAAGLDLLAWSHEALGLQFAMESDSRLALIGEHHAGAARGVENVVMLTLGTGIGQAAIIESRVLRGREGVAGHLGGHFPINFLHGRPCICGGVGCVETEAATWSLPTVAKKLAREDEAASALFTDGKINFRGVFEAARGGDPLAIRIREHCIAAWGACVVANVHAYDPEIVVIGGGVMQGCSADEILPKLQAHVREHAFGPCRAVRVCKAELGNDAALLGAMPLLRELAR